MYGRVVASVLSDFGRSGYGEWYYVCFDDILGVSFRARGRQAHVAPLIETPFATDGFIRVGLTNRSRVGHRRS